MLTKIAFIIKKLAAIVLAASIKVEDMPEIFKILAKFIKEEPDKSFSTQTDSKNHKWPLSLDSEGQDRFRRMTEKYPNIYRSGIAHPEKENSPFSISYTLGQFLANVGIVFEYIFVVENLKQHNEVEKKDLFNKFFKIWGSMPQMNAQSLRDFYLNKSISEGKKDLIDRLGKSADMIEKDIIPYLKESSK